MQIVGNWTGFLESSTPAVSGHSHSTAQQPQSDSEGLPCQSATLAAVCLLAPACHAMTMAMHHQVVQQLSLHRSSRQHLVLDMQVRPKQLKAVGAARTPLSPLDRHTNSSPATRSPQPWATGFLTPERLLVDEVKSSLQQLCLPLRSLLCLYML